MASRRRGPLTESRRAILRAQGPQRSIPTVRKKTEIATAGERPAFRPCTLKSASRVDTLRARPLREAAGRGARHATGLRPVRPQIVGRRRRSPVTTTTGQIAEHLWLSPWTVKTHFEHIRLKLQVRDRTAAVATALRDGIIAWSYAERMMRRRVVRSDKPFVKETLDSLRRSAAAARADAGWRWRASSAGVSDKPTALAVRAAGIELASGAHLGPAEMQITPPTAGS